MADPKYVTRTIGDGSVSISEEVIATIAKEALSRVDGVKLSGAAIKNMRGIKVKITDDKITVDSIIYVIYGQSVMDTAAKAQAEIAEAVGAMTGLTVDAVNVTVNGIAPNATSVK